MTREAVRPRIDLDELIGQLRGSRRPDIAVGLLLGAELLDQLPGVPDDYTRAAITAVHDLALAVYTDAYDVLAELLHNPAGEYVDEDHLAEDEPEPWP